MLALQYHICQCRRAEMGIVDVVSLVLCEVLSSSCAMFQIQILVKNIVSLGVTWTRGSRHKLKHRKFCLKTRKHFF